jgi:hypothetical protein
VKQLAAKFSFKVPGEAGDPNAHADAGKKVEKSFDYQECETPEEAEKVMVDKKWKLIDMVNEALKANARSNAYQSALLPYKPSEVPAEDIKERMIRDYIRLGIPEDTARKQVDALLAATATVQQSA